MKPTILSLLSLLLLSCSKEVPTTYKEGPIRLVLEVPAIAEVKKLHQIQVKALGEIPDVPMCLYVTMDESDLGPSCGDSLLTNEDRLLNFSVHFNVEWWLYKKGWSQQLINPAHMPDRVMPNLPLEPYVETDVDSVIASIQVSLWEVEPHPTKTWEWEKVDRLGEVQRKVRVTCTTDRRCMKPFGVR